MELHAYTAEYRFREINTSLSGDQNHFQASAVKETEAKLLQETYKLPDESLYKYCYSKANIPQGKHTIT